MNLFGRDRAPLIEEARRSLEGMPKHVAHAHERGIEGCGALRCVEAHHFGCRYIDDGKLAWTGEEPVAGYAYDLLGEWNLHEERYDAIRAVFHIPLGRSFTVDLSEALQ